MWDFYREKSADGRKPVVVIRWCCHNGVSEHGTSRIWVCQFVLTAVVAILLMSMLSHISECQTSRAQMCVKWLMPAGSWISTIGINRGFNWEAGEEGTRLPEVKYPITRDWERMKSATAKTSLKPMFSSLPGI